MNLTPARASETVLLYFSYIVRVVRLGCKTMPTFLRRQVQTYYKQGNATPRTILAVSFRFQYDFQL